MEKIDNPNINKNFKYPIPIRPKPIIPEQNSFLSSVKINTFEPASTSKKIVIDLTMSDAETEDSQENEISIYPTKSTKHGKEVLKKEKSIGNSKWTDTEIIVLLKFWKDHLEEWKRGRAEVYQKIINENILPDRNLKQIRNKVGKLRDTYLQKKKKANSTGKGSVEWVWFSQMEEILSQSEAIKLDYITDSSFSNSPNISESENLNDKEKCETEEPRKKKIKTGIEGISGVIAAMVESRDRFYEKKLTLEEHECQKMFELEEKKLTQQYELEKNKLELEILHAENEKVKLELEMLKFRNNND
ncbi:hypothetical protein RhiirC2_783637 [Rhizophagus irregularis]|uniref:Myb/SANT-like DNA-binding domain-containing protein n=1 Tax=Rhizophagus irregularis TaxID=588596 RepID=A0A2N1N0C6_9GLOM|nr:hypothetical protein RhiirC2_783637 [Rhizophagus irregularis]